MKKVVLALAILVLSTPALADSNGVTVEVNQIGDTNEMYVGYAMNNASDVNRPRAFGLVIEVNDANMGQPYGFDPNFYIYPGSIDINVDAPEGQEVNSWGSPIADYNDPNDNAIMEMASLYYPTGVSSPNRPPSSGILFKFGVDKTSGFSVDIEEDAQRGGVVMEDIDHPDVNDPGYVTLVDWPSAPTDCFPSAHPDYSNWVEVGKPDCWCYERQCHGDADNTHDGAANENKRRWVILADLNILSAGWNKKRTDMTTEEFDAAICADFNHDHDGSANTNKRRWVTLDDLNILSSNWNKKETDAGVNVDPNCLEVP